MTTERFVTGRQHTQCAAGLSYDRMIVKNTHDEYCDILLTLGACNSRVGTDTAGKRCVMLDDVIRALMLLDDWSRFSM
jgi:hypothetical protein